MLQQAQCPFLETWRGLHKIIFPAKVATFWAKNQRKSGESYYNRNEKVGTFFFLSLSLSLSLGAYQSGMVQRLTWRIGVQWKHTIPNLSG